MTDHGIAGVVYFVKKGNLFMRCVGWVVAVVLAATSFIATAGEIAAPITVTLLKSHTLKFDQDVSIISITNPAVLEDQVYSPRMIVLRGIAVGETQLIIMDKNHNEILSTVVVVTPELDRFVSVTRECGTATGKCAPEDEYNCFPRCVRVALPGTEAPATSATAGAGGGGDSGSGGGSSEDTSGGASGSSESGSANGGSEAPK